MAHIRPLHLSLFTLFALSSCNHVSPLYCKVSKVSLPPFNNLTFDVKCADFINKGFEYNDLIKMTIKDYDNLGNNKSFDVAFIKNYNEAGYYAPCLCNYEGKGETFDFSFGINPLKNKAQELVGKDIIFEMNKKRGYEETQKLISVSNKMSYEELGKDNLAFANFRDVTSVGYIANHIPGNRLYRGSSPFNNKDNGEDRYIVADRLLGAYAYRIISEISLSGTDEKIAEFMEKRKSEDSKSATYNLYIRAKNTDTLGKKPFFSVDLGTDFFTTGTSMKDGECVKAVYQYIYERSIQNTGVGIQPVYIHCNEGKDRTGFIVMTLEALAGVSLEDIVSDYMLTFKNYYNVSPIDSKARYDKLAELGIYRYLYSVLVPNPIEALSNIDDWYTFDAKAAVQDIVGNDANKLKNSVVNYLENILKIDPEVVDGVHHWLTTTKN